MRILMVHNFYQQPGGEDAVFHDEVALLRSRSHDVDTYTVHNDVIEGRSKWRVASDTVWNRDIAADLNERVRVTNRELVHFHNTFPLISPAAYGAVRRAGAATVQTLHNYRLICPKAMLSRGDGPCHQCVGKVFAWPSVLHGCYRESRLASTVISAMLSVHRLRNTWSRDVDRYIALSEFSRRQLVAGGLPADKITVKPNFVTRDPGLGDGSGGYALFLGRLSPEKGIDTLMNAWEHGAPFPLKIAGDGPLAGQVTDWAAQRRDVEYLGFTSPTDVGRLLGDAAVMVSPSRTYENFPKTLAEALASGTPVVASRLGAMQELVSDGVTGKHFVPDDGKDLSRQLVWLANHRSELQAMRLAARSEYEAKYTSDSNYDQIMRVYKLAVGASQNDVQPDNQEAMAGVA